MIRRTNGWPASVLVGGLAGLLASLAVLTVAVPLSSRIFDLRDAHAQETVDKAVRVTLAVTARGVPVDERLVDALGVDVLELRPRNGSQMAWDKGATPRPAHALCDSPATDAVFLEDAGTRWVGACRTIDGSDAAALLTVPRTVPERLLTSLAVLLALCAGLGTALGTQQVLRPLTDLSSKLQRIRDGERRLTARSTGIGELDAVIVQFNEASRQISEREDEIVDRVTVARQMARMVAHEVRNPLQSLELLTSLLADEEDHAERRELARRVHEEIRTLDAVVHRLLKDKRGGLRLSVAVKPLGPLIEQVISFKSEEAATKGIQLSSASLSPRPLTMDIALIRRCLENLIDNAIHAVSSDSGCIWVSTEDFPEFTHVYVDDNGPGIEAELAKRVFEADVTARPDGTGLGLALVRGVATAHGGKVWYEASPRGGARFVLRLPVMHSEADEDGENNS